MKGELGKWLDDAAFHAEYLICSGVTALDVLSWYNKLWAVEILIACAVD